VVDDSGHQCAVGDQQDSMEYLMNFMERLEEGLNEESGDVLKHLRVSNFQKKGGDASESFLTDDSEMAKSTVVSNDDAIGVSINEPGQ